MNLMDVAPRETTLEAGGHAKGVAVAVVSENKDDSGLGRVKVRYPWHEQPRNSYWARVAVPMAGKDFGSYWIPEVDTEVLVAFERGDLRFPYVIGCLWNGVDGAPLTNADGKNDLREFRSRKKHKLTFDDGEPGRVQLELHDGKRLTFDDKGIQIDDDQGNSIVIETSSGGMTLEATTKLTLKAPSVVIEGQQSVDVKANVNLNLRGTMVNIN